MIHSMSGFGRASNISQNEGAPAGALAGVFVEIKSVNSKGCDIAVKCAARYSFLEEWVRGIVREHLVRGKIDVVIFVQGGSDTVLSVDFDALDRFHSLLSEIERRYRLRRTRSAEPYLKFDGAIVHSRPEIDEKSIKEMVEAPLLAAVGELKEMRVTEGRHLEADLSEKLVELEKLLDIIEERRPHVVESKFETMKARVKKLVGEMANEQLLMQEIAIFAEKVDIEEEVVRLKTHISHIRKLISEEDIVGRKLDFISQELLREANTIGSKSPDEVISGAVISIKSIIDRIKEQVQNIL